jgi:hypothetical protein
MAMKYGRYELEQNFGSRNEISKDCLKLCWDRSLKESGYTTRVGYLPFQWNRKFWEELIAYFLSCDTDRTENDITSNSSIIACVFITAVTFFTEPLPSKDRMDFYRAVT